MASSFFQQLQKALEIEKNAISEAILTGACNDFPDYKYALGRIVGIQFAIDKIQEMEEAALKGDDF